MKRKKNWVCVIMALLLVAMSPITLYAKENDNDLGSDKTLSPYFVVEGEDLQVDSFPLKKTDVYANINGVIADISVVQTYTNEGKKPINASYVFPASTRATVHGMKMKIGDKTVTAVIKEKKKAKETFEKAKKKGQMFFIWM